MGRGERVASCERHHARALREEVAGRERVAERHADLAPGEHGEVLGGEGLDYGGAHAARVFTPISMKCFAISRKFENLWIFLPFRIL